MNAPSPPLRRRRWKWLRRLALGFAAALGIGACVISPPKPGSISLEQRLAMMPTEGLALFDEAEVRWTDQAVPYVLANDERDAPYLIGVVHGHLRRAQMEILLRVARGELAELGGALAWPIDELLRTLDLDRAVPAMAASLPKETRAWLERYAAGVNAQATASKKRPHDAWLLGLDLQREWTIEDSLTVARLASVDISLGRTIALLGLRKEPLFKEHAARLRAVSEAGIASFGPGEATPLGELARLARSGSNSFVVAPSRSASGAALLASDPHLGFFLPNFWCLIGYSTPERSVVGMSLPGVPAVALGRNEHIAWGGTNMAAYSSVLYDVSALNDEEFTLREEKLRARWWRSRTLKVRETEFGPVLSDLEIFESFDLPPVAIRWRGHEASDEMSAFLRASHARNWEEFREAWRGYAVAGQNMLYADAAGHIGQVLALNQIPAAAEGGVALIADPQDGRFRWTEGLGPTELPAALDPPTGYLISANNHPIKTWPPITAGGNSNDRVERMAGLIEAGGKLSLEDLMEIQRDVVLPSALAVRDLMLARANADAAPEFVPLLARWDGAYAVESKGAPAFRRWIYELIEGPYRERLGDRIANAWKGSTAIYERVAEDLREGWLTDAELNAALARAAEQHDLEQTWGEVHRLRMQHPLGAVPWLGRSWRFAEFAGAGTLGTVHKTAGPFTPEQHTANFGAQARHLSDLADPDANYFVLLGGQDGWLGSANLIDQAEMWQSGAFIQMPLTRAKIVELFPHVSTLQRQE